MHLSWRRERSLMNLDECDFSSLAQKEFFNILPCWRDSRTCAHLSSGATLHSRLSVKSWREMVSTPASMEMDLSWSILKGIFLSRFFSMNVRDFGKMYLELRGATSHCAFIGQQCWSVTADLRRISRVCTTLIAAENYHDMKSTTSPKSFCPAVRSMKLQAA